MKTPKQIQSQIRSGFTLIELLISLTILSFISIAIYQNTAQSFRLRETLQQDGEFYNAIHVAIEVMRRDLSHVYSPQVEALPSEMAKNVKGATPQTTPADPNKPNDPAALNTSPFPGATNPQDEEPLGTPLAFWSEPLSKDGFRKSRLNGEENKLSFLTNSGMRLYRDAAVSDFNKVLYTLSTDMKTETGLPALIRIEDAEVFSDKEFSDSKTTYTLLSNVKSIRFQYLDGENDKWTNRWDTSGIDHKNIFPWVIEVKIEVFLPSSIKLADPNSDRVFTVIERFRPELAL